jgi:hypothetical protein
MIGGNDRHDELSIKLLRTGEALISEGTQRGDDIITQIGNITIFMGGLIHNKSDLEFLSEVCTMMASKSMLSEGGLMEILSDLSMGEIEELIKLAKNRGKR